jgi:hypothetical protein
VLAPILAAINMLFALLFILPGAASHFYFKGNYLTAVAQSSAVRNRAAAAAAEQ